MENLTMRDLMVPADKFPKISRRASFYEALKDLCRKAEDVKVKDFRSHECMPPLFLTVDGYKG